eukprot:11017522-Alexandrium_andersonii.AAC.1
MCIRDSARALGRPSMGQAQRRTCREQLSLRKPGPGNSRTAKLSNAWGIRTVRDRRPSDVK